MPLGSSKENMLDEPDEPAAYAAGGPRQEDPGPRP